MTAGIWTESFPVRSYDVTPRGTASVLALCDFLQESAGNHAAELGVSMEELLAGDQAWVLAFLHLHIDRYPAWHDTVEVKTWPSGLERLYATREFVLSASGTSFARATSAWLVIDTNRRRPCRPPKVLHELSTPSREPAVEHNFEPLSVPDGPPDHKRDFRVRYHDLDVNRHVNNVRYVEWAVETLPSAWIDSRLVTDLSLQFRAETTSGDPVRATIHRMDAPSLSAPSSDDADTSGPTADAGESTPVLCHHLQHGDDDRTLAVAQTRWLRTE